MSAILVKNLPTNLHQRLKDEARRHHRSMNGEVLAILEETLATGTRRDLPPPIKPRKPVSDDWVVQVIRGMRDRRR